MNINCDKDNKMTKKAYKLCVLMPSYNKGLYIQEAIESVLAQNTNFDFRLIITDDASSDETLDIVQEFQKTHSNIITLLPSKENQGLLSNIIKAYKEMNCEYFCVLDPDDYYTDIYFLQKAVEFLDNNKDFSIYASGVMIINADNTQHKRENIKEAFVDCDFYDMLKGKAVLGHTTGSIFRNNYINDEVIRFLESKCAKGDTYKECAYREDDFRNRVHLTIGKSHFVNEIVGVYRYVRGGLYLGANTLRQINLGVRAYLDMYDYFGRKNLEWIDLAISRLFVMDIKVVKQCADIKDIVELAHILYRISTFKQFKLRLYLDKDETNFKKLSLRYKLLYKIYKYLDKKINKKLRKNMLQ